MLQTAVSLFLMKWLYYLVGAVASPLVRQKLRDHIIMKSQPTHDRAATNHCGSALGYRWETHFVVGTFLKASSLSWYSKNSPKIPNHPWNLILSWRPRLPAPNTSPNPQPAPCDQRKELTLRRTGETHRVVCVCDVGGGGSYPKVWALKATGDFSMTVLLFCVIWVRLKAGKSANSEAESEKGGGKE